jgi:hydroxylaminobenzene mutase
MPTIAVATPGADHGRRLARAGAVLFLVGLLLGLVIPQFTVPRLALSAHLLALLQGMFLLLVGLLWPRLILGPRLASAVGWIALYGSTAPIAATALAAAWGAGASILTMTAAAHQGTASQELVITVLLRSAGVSLIVTTAVLIWGLRVPR